MTSTRPRSLGALCWLVLSTAAIGCTTPQPSNSTPVLTAGGPRPRAGAAGATAEAGARGMAGTGAWPGSGAAASDGRAGAGGSSASAGAAGESARGAGGEATRGAGTGAAGSLAAGSGSDAAGTQSGAPCHDFVMPLDCPATAPGELPGELRCTGLYGAWETRTPACGVLPYTPAFQLWSDGADKSRYVWLPPGSTIDVSDPEGFVYPVGTQFWKEFRLKATNYRPGETRLLRKTEAGFSYTTYVWSEDGKRATRTDEGVVDLRQTGHTVPSREQCKECHAGRRDFVLGWDWLMLGPGASGVTRDMLVSRGLVRGIGAQNRLPQADVPGDSVERAALGYLHANCGVSCHNVTRSAAANDISLHMRLEVGDLNSVLDTDVVRTGVNHVSGAGAVAFVWGVPAPRGPYYDFRPGDVMRSLAVARMGVRGLLRQMPRLGTNVVDPDGMRIVSDWVNHMTPARGYPAAGP